MADEYLDLVHQLWASWDADAVVRDRETGTYVDASKVRTIDFEGPYYTSRGTLNTLPPPYGKPVLCQAGASPKGRAFAAKYADTIISPYQDPALMKAYRDDIRHRVEAAGRKPDDVKVDLDEPLPEVSTNGERGTLEAFLAKAKGQPLTRRELAYGGLTEPSTLVGTPEQVAGKMGEMMETVGGDGFLVTSPVMRLNRRYIVEITDGLVPALQRAGLMRASYTYEGFRDNLLEF